MTHAGVSLTQACFAARQYEDRAAARCLSNLLATGFRRFIVDVFWDPDHDRWSLCPVKVPDTSSSSPSSPSSTPAANTISTSIQPRFAGPIPNSQLTEDAAASPASGKAAARTVTELLQLPVRQETTPATRPSSSSSLGSTALSNAASTIATPSTTLPIPLSESLVQIGSYRCTSSINLLTFTAVLSDFLDQTDNTLNASLAIVILNLHQATSPDEPTNSSAATSTLASVDLPAPTNLLSDVLGLNLSSYIYTPTMLQADRGNLNSSWYAALPLAKPNSSYFTTTITTTVDAKSSSSGVHSTPDGWPSEAYLELHRVLRLAVGLGQVDDSLRGYNFSGDEDTIFAPGMLTAPRSVSIGQDGVLQSGCFYNRSAPTTAVTAAVNSSWAVADQLALPPPSASSADSSSSSSSSSGAPFYNTNGTLAGVANLAACGISPVVNQSLLGVSADQRIDPYKAVAYSSLWSWAPGQPIITRNANISSNDSSSRLDSGGGGAASVVVSSNGPRLRCAALDRRLAGRWRVVDCTERHRAACRVADGSPYAWRVSSTAATYSESGDRLHCGADATFAVPRTGLENRYLLEALLTQAQGEAAGADHQGPVFSSSASSALSAGAASAPSAPDRSASSSSPASSSSSISASDPLLWVDFNSLAVPNCWVQGVNASCPYSSDVDEEVRRRTVIVPTVAAVIVFVLALLTFFVKCAANRQNSRKRRRRRKGDDGWDYEGVPS